MAFQKNVATHDLPPCPKCGVGRLFTIESRKTQESVRRRKECNACKYRFTTHEVTSEFFDTAKYNASFIHKLQKMMNINSTKVESIEGEEEPCVKCKYNIGARCSFDLPEYMTEESMDCTYYKT